MEANDIKSAKGTSDREVGQHILTEEQKYFLLNNEEVLDKIIEGLMKDFRLL